jgi:hypothetical protein
LSYVTKYQSNFQSELSENYEILFDFLNYAGGITDIKVVDVINRSVVADDNRLTPILGKELLITIEVGVSDPVSILDLIATHDNDIRVTCNLVKATGDKSMIFQGFVVVEDNNQPLQDKPCALNIRALDGLGHLKGVDLQDTNGLRFVGSLTIIEWIAQILYKTDQTLPIRVYFNIFPFNLTESSAFDEIALNSNTFSQGDAFNVSPTDPSIDINASSADDCYTALEKIIRCFKCRIFMEDGRWNIVSLWDHMNPEGMSFVEFALQAPISGIVPVAQTDIQLNQNYDVQIGKSEVIYPFNADADIYLKLATKWIKLTYNYDQSQNKVCNQDFTEGTLNAFTGTISSSIQDTTINPPVTFNYIGYDAYCWTKQGGTITAGSGGNYQPFPATVTTADVYIRSVLDSLDYEAYRYLTVKSQSALAFVKSSTFKIDIGDCLEVAFDWRLMTSGTGGVRSVFYILLAGIDGTFWALGYPGSTDDYHWFQCDSNYYALAAAGVTPFIHYDSSGGTANNEWNTFDVKLGATGNFNTVPVSGDCFLVLPGENDGTETWFKNISVTIFPFLQGSFRQLKGDYNYSSIADNIKLTESDTVEISDSPKRYFKGALLQNDGQTLLPPSFHRRGKNGLESFRFTQGMERIMWNLLNHMNYKIEGTFKGLLYQTADLDLHPAGFLNNYFFVDGDFQTKKFILCSFDRSLATGTGRHVFVEIVKDENTDPFIDPALSPNTFKFDYIFQ